jgi:hypothetical protein
MSTFERWVCLTVAVTTALVIVGLPAATVVSVLRGAADSADREMVKGWCQVALLLLAVAVVIGGPVAFFMWWTS